MGLVTEKLKHVKKKILTCGTELEGMKILLWFDRTIHWRWIWKAVPVAEAPVYGPKVICMATDSMVAIPRALSSGKEIEKEKSQINQCPQH